MSKLQFPHPKIAARPSWKWFILSTVLLGATMSALDVSIVNVAMPTLKNTFGVSMAVIEWIAMAYMLDADHFSAFIWKAGRYVRKVQALQYRFCGFLRGFAVLRHV